MLSSRLAGFESRPLGFVAVDCAKTRLAVASNSFNLRNEDPLIELCIGHAQRQGSENSHVKTGGEETAGERRNVPALMRAARMLDLDLGGAGADDRLRTGAAPGAPQEHGAWTLRDARQPRLAGARKRPRLQDRPACHALGQRLHGPRRMSRPSSLRCGTASTCCRARPSRCRCWTGLRSST